MSVEDFQAEQHLNGGGGYNTRLRSARARRTGATAANGKNVRKSVSIDSLNYDSDSGQEMLYQQQGGNRHQQQMRFPSTPNSPSKYYRPGQTANGRDYYDESDRDESSSTPSPTKSRYPAASAARTVAFRSVPDVDHQTPRMVNGTPHHRPFPRIELPQQQDAAMAEANRDEILAIETENAR
jgi:hypothetical protein